MTRRFDSFVILAEMRTGSNLLESLLNGMAGVTCHGEAFNLAHLGGAGRRALLGMTIEDRNRDPLALLARIGAQPGLNGFRLFHDHDLRVFDAVLGDPRCAKIVLSRNPVDSWVSLEIARETEAWLLTDIRRRRTAKARFRAGAFDAFLQRRAAFRARVQRALQTSGQTAFHLDYEDLRDAGVLAGLADWLGHPGGLDGAQSPMLVQNPEPLPAKVTNWPEMQAALAGVDYFGLSRLPNFEPRRGPAVTNWVAAAGAPALWLSLAPEPRVEAWLSALGRGGGVQGGFTFKTLTGWTAAHPGFRSFTLLRHPLDRADRAFRAAILGGGYPRVRAALIRDHGLALPPVAEAAALTAADYRAALMAFLRFLALNLNGQTAIRVDRVWCSQIAALQGMAAVGLPDLICRADRLAEDLGHLAAMLRLPSPPVTPDDSPPGPAGLPLLADICDGDLQAAAAAAYPRDMQAFGFGPWRPAP